LQHAKGTNDGQTMYVLSLAASQSGRHPPRHADGTESSGSRS
jgi:hypothetical protein